jgi:hypothetical protein
MDEQKRLGYIPAGGTQSEHQDVGADRDAGSSRTGRRAAYVLTERDCLERLSQLPGLLALGLIEPAQANAMRATLGEILRHCRHAGQEGAHGALADGDVLEIYRRDPQVFDLISGMLTADQIAAVMREATDGDGQV